MADPFAGYKGVMLCNRPPNVDPPQQPLDPKVLAMVNRAAFVSTVLEKSPLGIPPKRPVRQDAGRKTKTKESTVIKKHKKYIANLSQQKLAEAEQQKEEKLKAERAKQALAEKSAKFRETLKRLHEEGADEETKTAALESFFRTTSRSSSTSDSVQGHNESSTPSTTSGNRSSHGEGDEVISIPSDPVNGNRSSHEGSNDSESASNDSTRGGIVTPVAPTPRKWVRRKRSEKPAWAMTIAEGEEAEDAEADDLVAFAEALDYDGFLEDLEVKSALKFVNSKVARIKAEQEEARRREQARSKGIIGEDDDEYEWVEVDEDGYTASESAILKRNPALRGKHHNNKQDSNSNSNGNSSGWNSSTKVEDRSKTPVAISSDTLQAIRAATPSIGNVHSNASIRSLVDQVSQGGNNIGEDDPSLALTRKVAVGGAVAHPHAVTSNSNSNSSNNSYNQGSNTIRVPEPRIVIVNPSDAGTVPSKPLNSTMRASSLPYLYRNPAV